VVTALYDTTITHDRATPVGHRFSYRSYCWLVDLDDLPRLPRRLRPLARFEARDHLGDPCASLRTNLDALLAVHGIDLAGGRILMLANARVLGYSFNPISVFWCHAPEGSLRCVVAEVHNTYGGRHAYVVQTDVRGRATVGKALYVSPFNPVDGEYRLSLPEPGDSLRLTVALRRPDTAPFVATVRGRRRAVTTAAVLRASVRVPVAPLLGSARIRLQGIRLWRRGLPVQPRPGPGRTALPEDPTAVPEKEKTR
jgi:DUF1365 family protein